LLSTQLLELFIQLVGLNKGGNYMDYLMNGIIIVFVLACIVFCYNALKIQHGSKNFPTPKDDSEKKENDK